jgi:hypothetical protein
MEIVIVGLELLRRLLSKVGPYLAMEIILPGGTLLALVLYLYRRQAGLKDSTAGCRLGALSRDYRVTPAVPTSERF